MTSLTSAPRYGHWSFEKDQVYSSAKKKIQISQLAVIHVFKESTGGMRCMDQNISRYRVKVSGQTWYSSLINYIINVTLTNNGNCTESVSMRPRWIWLSKGCCMFLFVIQYGATKTKDRGRYAQIGVEIRYNMTPHWISHRDKKTWCAPGHVHCYTKCEKCQIGVSKRFKTYHKNSVWNDSSNLHAGWNSWVYH